MLEEKILESGFFSREFYVLLKNPKGGGGIGSPSITRHRPPKCTVTQHGAKMGSILDGLC
jgi:hypothetical protein